MVVLGEEDGIGEVEQMEGVSEGVDGQAGGGEGGGVENRCILAR